MISFTCDYIEGAHPEILRRLAETNLVQEPGYGEDSFTVLLHYCEKVLGCVSAGEYHSLAAKGTDLGAAYVENVAKFGYCRKVYVGGRTCKAVSETRSIYE